MFDLDVAAYRTAGANTLRFFIAPVPWFKQEIFADQRSDRANIRRIHREFVIQGFAGEDIDFRMITAILNHQFIGAGNFFRKAHATRTEDATGSDQQDFRSQILTRWYTLVKFKATLIFTVFITVILQITLAGLVALRAIHRVI